MLEKYSLFKDDFEKISSAFCVVFSSIFVIKGNEENENIIFSHGAYFFPEKINYHYHNDGRKLIAINLFNYKKEINLEKILENKEKEEDSLSFEENAYILNNMKDDKGRFILF